MKKELARKSRSHSSDLLIVSIGAAQLSVPIRWASLIPDEQALTMLQHGTIHLFIHSNKYTFLHSIGQPVFDMDTQQSRADGHLALRPTLVAWFYPLSISIDVSVGGKG